MKTPADGWDADERQALTAIEPALEELRARHAAEPPIDLLRAARAGVLPADVQPQAGRLLDDNRWYRALVEGMDAVDVDLSPADARRLLQRIESEHRRETQAATTRRWLWRPVLAAAAVLVLAATAWTVWQRTPQPGPAQEPQTQVAVAPTPPAFVLPLDAPAITVSAAGLTYRGAASDNGLLADLKVPFDALRAGDYQTAARELEPLAARYPMSVEVAYYEGVARLFLGDPQGALTSLSRAERLADASFLPDIAWYAAVASERAGLRDDARARLDTLCSQKGPRSAEACAAAPAFGAAVK